MRPEFCGSECNKNNSGAAAFSQWAQSTILSLNSVGVRKHATLDRQMAPEGWSANSATGICSWLVKNRQNRPSCPSTCNQGSVPGLESGVTWATVTLKLLVEPRTLIQSASYSPQELPATAVVRNRCRGVPAGIAVATLFTSLLGVVLCAYPQAGAVPSRSCLP